jgi:dihydroflavonol-4-reductase
MKIGIIGATGMLGHHTAGAIVAGGHELVILRRENAKLARISDFDCENRIADLNHPGSLNQAFAGLDGVIHSAAYYPTQPRPWREDLEAARKQMQGFLDAVRDSDISKAVYVGGSIAIPKRSDGQPADEVGTYTEPPETTNPYVQCKWLMDQMARTAASDGLPVSIAIPSMTFGEFDYGPSTGQIITGIASGRMTRYVSGLRNIIYAGDAGSGILRVLEAGQNGERYLLTGTNTDMQDLVSQIARIAAVPLPTPVPLAMARILSGIQSWRYRVLGGALPVISSTAIAVMSAGQHLDGAKAASELDFQAITPVDEALRRAYTWFVENRYIE